MMLPLLKLLNVPPEAVHRLVECRLVFSDGLHWRWMPLLAAAVVALAVWSYRCEGGSVSLWRRYSMAALRALFLLLLLTLLLRPVVELKVEGGVRQTLVLMLDGSASMAIQDPYAQEADQQQAASAGQLQPSRALRAQAALADPPLQLIRKLARDYELKAYAFGDAVTPLETPTMPEPEAAATALGDGLQEVLSRTRNLPRAGILLVTDGGQNSGSSAVCAAAMAKEQNVPLYICAFGNAAARDVIVADVAAPGVAFLGEELAVTVRLRAQAIAGLETKLVLTAGGEPVAEQRVVFSDNSEQTVLMRFVPARVGQFDLAASVAPCPGETVTANNSRSRQLWVLDGRIRVLMIEQSPRWEFRHLQKLLQRDRRVELKCLLFDSAPSSSACPAALASFPATQEELAEFDVVVVGDVSPAAFQPEQLQWLEDFVRRFGGSLVVIAGTDYMPWAYRHTVLEDILPVEFETGTWESAERGYSGKPLALELTAAGRTAPMLQLSDRPTENIVIWQQLPPLQWVAPVGPAKPAAEVWVVQAKGSHGAGTVRPPVVAFQYCGLGRLLYIGTDSIWRWRENRGEARYARFWTQVIEAMGLPKLLGGGKSAQLFTDRAEYLYGERVTVTARLFGSELQPVVAPAVAVVCQPVPAGDAVANAGQREFMLRPVAEQPGTYRGELTALKSGRYRVALVSEPQVQVDFSVVSPSYELSDTALNEPLLREMARISDGAFFREEDLHRLPDAIRRNCERVERTVAVALGSTPLFFLLVVAVVTTEWLLRKMSGLK